MGSNSAETDEQENGASLTTASIRRAVAAAAMGNAMEWYDFGVYSYLATTIGELFFQGAHGGGLVKTFGVFAVSFVVRPLGGIFFGPLGDKIGRSKVLVATILMMACGTTAAGLLGTADTIGFWAPILLIVTRLIQGFSTGGEYGGAATYIVESSPDDTRGFLSSFLEFGTLGGYTLGAGIVTIMTVSLSHQAMLDWGWRVPFLAAAPLGLIGLYLRLKLEDSSAFKSASEKGETSRTPLREIVTEHWDQMLQCIGLVVLLNVAYYTVLTYLPSYFEKHLGFSSLESLEMLIVVYICMMCVIAFIGRLSDYVGRKPVFGASAIGFLCLAYFAFWLFQLHSLGYTIIGLAILAFLTVLLSGTIPSMLPAIFPTRIRYGGFAISYNISTSAFGGTAPFIISALISATGYVLMPAFYLMLAAAVGLATVFTVRETAGKPLAGSSGMRGQRPRRRSRFSRARE
jgi:MHS family proline/betaine transporter-like MFS transporter